MIFNQKTADALLLEFLDKLKFKLNDKLNNKLNSLNK